MRNAKVWVIGGLAVLVGMSFWQPPVAAGGGVGSPTGAFGSAGGAVLVPGGKKADSDCYAELAAYGFAGNVVTSSKGSTATCTDGDACDAGPCGDNQCDIKVKVCVNQTDPNLSSCTAPSGLDSLKLKGKGKNKGLIDIKLPSALDGAFCFGQGGSSSSVAGAFGLGSSEGAFLIELPAGTEKSNGKLKGGTVAITGKAKTSTKPKVDPDSFTFVCKPRPAGSACPGSPSGAFLD